MTKYCPKCSKEHAVIFAAGDGDEVVPLCGGRVSRVLFRDDGTYQLQPVSITVVDGKYVVEPIP